MRSSGKHSGGAAGAKGAASAPPRAFHHAPPKGLRWRALFIAIGVLLVLCETYFLPPTSRAWQQLEVLATVARFNLRGQQPMDESIRVLGITQQTISSLSEYGEQYPFARDIHALVLKRLADAGAKVIVVDILFSEEGSWDESEDAALRNAVLYCREQHGCQVILSTGIDVTQTPGGPAMSPVYPAPIIMEAEPLLGVTNTEQRLSYRLTEQGSFTLELEGGYHGESLPVAAYRVVKRIDDDDPAASNFRINYAGQPDTYPGAVYSLDALLPESFKAEEWDSLDTARQALKSGTVANLRAEKLEKLGTSFKSATVFYGSRNSADNDYFNTPFAVMFGVDTLAASFDTLLRQREITSLGTGVLWFSAILLTLAAWLLSLLRPLRNAILAAVGALMCIAALDVLLFINLIDLPLAFATAAFMLPFLACTIYGGSVEEAERRKIRATFGRYMSDELVAQLVEDPKLADLGGQRLDVAVMFCDIRNYSTLTEHLEPHWTVLMLNIFLGAMTQVIRKHGGFIDKYMGDGLLVCFGGPVPLENPAQASVAAALEMVRVLYEEVHPRLLEDNLPLLKIGIGVHFGPVVMGNIGSESRMDFTVVGDSVNVAARVETATKDNGWAVLVTKEVVEGSPEFRFELVGEQQVKGREQAVQLYRPLSNELGDRLKL